MSSSYSPFNSANPQSYENTMGTYPAPPVGADKRPVPFWSSARTRSSWVTKGTDQVYTWRSPVFNLRPDLESAGGTAKSGVPIFNRSGSLFVQIDGLASVPATTQSLRVQTSEFASVNWGAPTPAELAVARVNAPVEITAQVMFGGNQPDRVILTFDPLGESKPVRFWMISLDFIKPLTAWASDQILYVEAAYY